MRHNRAEERAGVSAVVGAILFLLVWALFHPTGGLVLLLTACLIGLASILIAGALVKDD